MTDTILWDIDATLLNFKLSENWALRKCFQDIGMKEVDEEFLERYRKINHAYWRRLEKGEVTKAEVLNGRFRDFFSEEGIDADSQLFNESYQQSLGEKVFPNDDGIKLCQSLKGRYKQYAASNGTRIAQYKKLKLSGLDEIFDGIFISEEVGVEKPSKEFFDHIFREIGEDKRESSVMIGDSLTSDMLGASRAGIVCVWYNPTGAQNKENVSVDYEIKNLWEIEKILK